MVRVKLPESWARVLSRLLSWDHPYPFVFGDAAPPSTQLFDQVFRTFVGAHATSHLEPYDIRRFLATVYYQVGGSQARI